MLWGKSDCAGKYRGKSKFLNDNELYQYLKCKIIFVYPLPTPSEQDQYYKTAWLKDKNVMSVSKEMEITYQMQGDVRWLEAVHLYDRIQCERNSGQSC